MRRPSVEPLKIGNEKLRASGQQFLPNARIFCTPRATLVVRVFLAANAAPAAAGDNPCRLEAEIRPAAIAATVSKPVRADQASGSGFRIPGGKPAPARPPVPAKVLGCFKTCGCVQPEGVTGAKADIPVRRRKLSSLSRCAIVAQPVLPVQTGQTRMSRSASGREKLPESA